MGMSSVIGELLMSLQLRAQKESWRQPLRSHAFVPASGFVETATLHGLSFLACASV